MTTEGEAAPSKFLLLEYVRTNMRYSRLRMRACHFTMVFERKSYCAWRRDDCLNKSHLSSRRASTAVPFFTRARLVLGLTHRRLVFRSEVVLVIGGATVSRKAVTKTCHQKVRVVRVG